MKVQCGQCPAKYAVSDDRIRDKKVRIRCRRCDAAIVVDGKTNPPLVTSTPARRSVGPASSIPAPRPAPPEGAADAGSESESRPPSPRPVAHTILGGLEAPHAAEQYVVEQLVQARLNSPKLVRNGAHADADANGERAREPPRGMPAPNRGLTDPPAGANTERWRVALTQQDLRWMTTEEITLAFRDGAVKLETFVFRSGMPTWLTLLEVGEISRALSEAGLVTIAPSPVEESANDTTNPDPSPGSRRVSSIPPPRRAARNPGSGTGVPGASSEEAALETEESMAFALVPGRATTTKRSPEASSPENDVGALPSTEEAGATQFTTLAGLPEPAPTAGAAADGSLPAAAASSAEASPGPLAPAESKPAGESPIAVRELSFERPTQTASSALPDPNASTDLEGPAHSAAGLAEPPKGTHLWIWLLLAVVFVVAAALLLGPRFGLRLL